MKSRLAFSIASLVNPDILILDEVLSVGDGAFRKKSEAKMKEIIHSGATTILVSHSVNQIRSLCNKVLWLNKGQQVAFGPTDKICDAYEHFLATPKNKQQIPKNMEEIYEISRKFRLYLKLSEKERNDADSEKRVFLDAETANARENRWMEKINALSQAEQDLLYANK